MAWSPKTFDITKINNGNQYKNGDGVYADDINAVVEGAAYAQALAVQEPNTKNVDKVGTPSVSIEIYDGLPRLKFENLKGEKGDDHNLEINDLYTRVEENARQINTVKQVMVQNEQVVMLPLVDSFKTRITAKGANIFDEQYTPVSTVEGNTVVDKNSNTFKNAYFKGITSTGKNLISNPSQHISVANGYYDEVITNVKLLPSTTYCLSFDYKINSSTDEKPTCDVGYGDTIMRVSLTPNGVPLGRTSGHFSTTFTTPQSFSKVSTQNPKFVARYVRIGTQGNLDAEVSNIQLTFGDTEQDFTPYEESTIELPTAVESGLGTTIDFENRKIINRGKEIVLDGTETIYYKDYGNGYYVLYWNGKLGGIKERRAEYVSTDAEKYSENNQWVNGLLWVGLDDDILYWVNAADYLGVYTGTDIEQMKANFAAYLKQRYASGNPVKIRYVASTGTETALGAGVLSSYKAWKNGTETIIQGDIDNSEYGANPKITQTYIAKVGGEE